VIAHTPRMDVT